MSEDQIAKLKVTLEPNVRQLVRFWSETEFPKVSKSMYVQVGL